jgi:hypothetical protein
MNKLCQCGLIASTKCQHKLCGRCCKDNKCNKHTGRKKSLEQTIKSKNNTIDVSDKYDSDLDGIDDHIDSVYKILYNDLMLPNEISKYILSFIDKRVNCSECNEVIDLSESCKCNFCQVIVCFECSKYATDGCYNKNCYYCRNGYCVNRQWNRCCDSCHDINCDRCKYCEKCDCDSHGLVKCDKCHDIFCRDCDKGRYIHSKCHFIECVYCKKGICYNVHLIKIYYAECYDENEEDENEEDENEEDENEEDENEEK